MMKRPSLLLDSALYSSSGNLDILLAEQYLKANEWGKAIQLTQKALKTLKPDRAGNAFLILGHSYLRQGQVKRAKAAFLKATHFQEYQAKAQYCLEKLEMNPEDFAIQSWKQLC
ncbi:MAG: hypothetical protein ACR2P1_02745 [Pseudomonadales bacterium]